MGTEMDPEEQKIDDISQVLLQVLRDRGGRSTAAPLRDAAGLSQNQQVHYRMNEYLIPQRLVQKAPEQQEQPGGRKDAIIYELREAGQEWLQKHGEDITRAVDAAKVVESLERTRETVSEFSDRMDGLEQKYRARTDTISRHSDRLGKTSNRIGELDDRMDSLARADFVDDMNDRLGNLVQAHNQVVNEELAQVDDRLSDLEEDVDALWSQASESDDIIADESEARDEFLRADLADVREIAERADRSWWARLLGR